MSIAMAASASTGGGVLPPPPFSIAAFTNHYNRRICQGNSSIAFFPKQNLRISSSISAFSKQNIRISPSKFSISTLTPKQNYLGIFPSEFDNRNRGSLFQSRCSSEIAESDNISTKWVSMIDRFKSMMYQRFKQFIGSHGLEPTPHPQYYRIINLEVLWVADDLYDETQFEKKFPVFKNACDACHRVLVKQNILEMLFGDLCRKLVLHAIAEFLQYYHAHCVCSRSTACFSYNNPSEEHPVFLRHPPCYTTKDNLFDLTYAYEIQLQVSVDGIKSDESICTCDNLQQYMQRLLAFEGKYYALSVNYRRMGLLKKRLRTKDNSFRVCKVYF